MFIDQIWISNGFKKVKNPAKVPQVTDIYQGNLPNSYNFKFQTENCNKIREKLEPHGIHMTEIYTSKRSGKVTFVILFNNPNFMWQKYEGVGFGSTQNYIYYKDHRINTKQFIELTNEQVSQILN
jgi:hypothetical protein